MNKTKYYVEWEETSSCGYYMNEKADVCDTKKEAQEKIEELYTDGDVDRSTIKVYKMKQMRYSKGETKIFE